MGRIIDISEALLELGLSVSVTETERAIAGTALVKAEGAIKRHLKYDPVQSVRTEYYPQLDFNNQTRRSIWEVTDTQAFIRSQSKASSDELQVVGLPVRVADSDGNNTIDLRIDYNGRSGTQLGSFAVSSRQVEGVDFWPNYDVEDSAGRSVCRDGIIRSEGLWPDSPGSVKLVYVAGYTDAELHGQDVTIDASPIMDAVIDETVRRVQKAFSRMKRTNVGFVGGPFSSEKLGDYSYSLDLSTLSRLVGTGWDILPETAMKLEQFIRMDMGVM